MNTAPFRYSPVNANVPQWLYDLFESTIQVQLKSKIKDDAVFFQAVMVGLVMRFSGFSTLTRAFVPEAKSVAYGWFNSLDPNDVTALEDSTLFFIETLRVWIDQVNRGHLDMVAAVVNLRDDIDSVMAALPVSSPRYNEIHRTLVDAETGALGWASAGIPILEGERWVQTGIENCEAWWATRSPRPWTMRG